MPAFGSTAWLLAAVLCCAVGCCWRMQPPHTHRKSGWSHKLIIMVITTQKVCKKENVWGGRVGVRAQLEEQWEPGVWWGSLRSGMLREGTNTPLFNAGTRSIA